MDATAKAQFQTVDDYFKQNKLSWEKCMSVTVYGVAAMQGYINGVVTKKSLPRSRSNSLCYPSGSSDSKKFTEIVNNGESTGFKNFFSEIIIVVNFVRSCVKNVEYSCSCVRKLRHQIKGTLS